MGAMLTEELWKETRPPCVAQYVPSTTGLQGAAVVSLGDCAAAVPTEAAAASVAAITTMKLCGRKTNLRVPDVSLQHPLLRQKQSIVTKVIDARSRP